MADCLASTHDAAHVSNSHHSGIMKRFYAILATNSGRVMHAPEMCKAVGVSNRTLTTCCHEALGMSPHRYLRLRQLHLSRAGRAGDDHSHRDRYCVWLLGYRTFCRCIPGCIRRAAFRNTRPAGWRPSLPPK
jgi:AraC-like DNA-binding protein